MGRKLKVSTKTSRKQEKIKKIINVLEDFPEGLNPKTISFYTKINVNTIKSLLPKISKIRKGELRGLYYLVDKSRHDNIFDWNFHNAILSINTPNYEGETIKKSESFGAVNYGFTLGAKSKKATFRISSEPPINISSICICSSLLSVLVEKYTSLITESKDILVSSIEFNKDYINLRLDGVKCITLDSLITQFKLYQKQGGLRCEYKFRVPFEIENIFSSLQNMAISLDLYSEVIKLKKNQKIIIDALRNSQSLLGALLNKIDYKN